MGLVNSALCLCFLYLSTELNGSPATKKYKCTEKKSLVPLKVNYFSGGMRSYLSVRCSFVSNTKTFARVVVIDVFSLDEV